MGQFSNISCLENQAKYNTKAQQRRVHPMNGLANQTFTLEQYS
jgi:hypothetical protein